MEVEVRGPTRSLAELSARLKAASRGDLQKRLTRGLRKAATPIVADLKSTVSSLPVRGVRGGGAKQRLAEARRSRAGWRKAQKGGTGLRATTARGIGVQVSPGRARVRIRLNPNVLPPDQRKLPKYLDRPQGWRHPVFGDRDVWVQQYGKPWWAATIRPHLPAATREVAGAMDEVAREIEG